MAACESESHNIVGSSGRVGLGSKRIRQFSATSNRRESHDGGFRIHDPCWRRRLARKRRASSRDLRDRVVAAVEGGVSCRRTAERSGVSAAGPIRWRQLALAHGTTAGKVRDGDRRTAKIGDHAAYILEAITQ